MPDLLLLLAVVACPIVMGIMMWMMGRAPKVASDPSAEQQLVQLRAEIERLKTDRAVREQSSGG